MQPRKAPGCHAGRTVTRTDRAGLAPARRRPGLFATGANPAATQSDAPALATKIGILSRLAKCAVPLGICLWLSGCAPAPEVKFHLSDAYPERLSAWGVLQKSGDRLVLGRNVIAYDINTPLFSDYARKLRTIWMPAGTSAEFAAYDSYAMPRGTVLSKTFFYPMENGTAQALHGWNGDVGALDLADTRLIETRLLVQQQSGWEAVPYVWRGDDAWLTITGELQTFELEHNTDKVSVDYIVPTRNDCAACHATGQTGELVPIGIKTRHLNRGYHGSSINQLDRWQQLRLLRGAAAPSTRARNADWRDPGESMEHLARSYLDANCGHCHNPESATDTSGLWLDYRHHPLRRMGLCKPPIAAGRGTGGRFWAIAPGAPDASILTFRMAATNPGIRMPEIGRTLAHAEGVAAVSAWVASLAGACE